MRAITVPGETAFGLMLLGADRFSCVAEPPVLRPLTPFAIHHGYLQAEAFARTEERRQSLVAAAEQAGWTVDRHQGALVDKYVFTKGAERHVAMGRRDRSLFWGATLGSIVGMIRVGPCDGFITTWNVNWNRVSGACHSWPVHARVYAGGEVELPAQPGVWAVPEALAQRVRLEVARAERE